MYSKAKKVSFYSQVVFDCPYESDLIFSRMWLCDWPGGMEMTAEEIAAELNSISAKPKKCEFLQYLFR